MFGFGKKKACCGVQILDHMVKIAEIRCTAQKIDVLKSRSIELEAGAVKNGKIADGTATAEKIAQAVKELGLEGARVHLTIPTASVFLRKSVYPSLKDKEIRNLIDVDLYSGSQLPFKNPVFDFIRLGEPAAEAAAASEDAKTAAKKGQKQEEFLVLATPAETVESHCRVVEEAGLVPVSVELAPLALYRLMVRYLKIRGEGLSGDFILLNAETGHADINIFSGGIPAFIRSVQINSHYMFGAETDPDEFYGRNLSIELGRILNYYKYSISNDQQDVNRMFLVGENGKMETLAAILANAYHGEIEIFPMDGLVTEANAELDAYAVPIGLALKGA